MLSLPFASVNLQELLDALYEECKAHGIRDALVSDDYETQIYKELHHKGFTDATYFPALSDVDFVANNKNESYGVQAKNYKGRIYFGIPALYETCNLLSTYSPQRIKPMIVYSGRLGSQVEKEVRNFDVTRFPMTYKPGWQITAFDTNVTVRKVLRTLINKLAR